MTIISGEALTAKGIDRHVTLFHIGIGSRLNGAARVEVIIARENHSGVSQKRLIKGTYKKSQMSKLSW